MLNRKASDVELGYEAPELTSSDEEILDGVWLQQNLLLQRSGKKIALANSLAPTIPITRSVTSVRKKQRQHLNDGPIATDN